MFGYTWVHISCQINFQMWVGWVQTCKKLKSCVALGQLQEEEKAEMREQEPVSGQPGWGLDPKHFKFLNTFQVINNLVSMWF